MEIAKKHIGEIVEDYIRMFPEEFYTFKEGMNLKRNLTRDEYASLEGSTTSRGLYEMPETLSTMLVTGLEEEEMVWLKMGGKDGHEGGHWFARHFKVFALPESI